MAFHVGRQLLLLSLGLILLLHLTEARPKVITICSQTEVHHLQLLLDTGRQQRRRGRGRRRRRRRWLVFGGDRWGFAGDRKTTQTRCFQQFSWRWACRHSWATRSGNDHKDCPTLSVGGRADSPHSAGGCAARRRRDDWRSHCPQTKSRERLAWVEQDIQVDSSSSFNHFGSTICQKKQSIKRVYKSSVYIYFWQNLRYF